MSEKKEDKKVSARGSTDRDKQGQYTPYTRAYRVMLEKGEKPDEDKKD